MTTATATKTKPYKHPKPKTRKTPWTMQAYYDEAIKYLLQQPEQCRLTSLGVCCFSSEDGNRCVVGHFIPEDHPGVNCPLGLERLKEVYPDLAGTAWPDHEGGDELAKALQRLHDVTDNRVHGRGGLNKEGRRNAHRIAREFGLKPFDFANYKGKIFTTKTPK